MTVPERAESAVSIRPVERADLLEVFSIEKAAFPQPWPFSAFERYVGERGFLVAVDEEASAEGPWADDGAVVGYVVADRVRNHRRPLGHIKDIAVHPDRRGEGLGSALLDRALGVLASRGVGTVKLEVRRSNEKAIDMYREFGFEWRRTVPRYYDDGEDAFVMVREADGE